MENSGAFGFLFNLGSGRMWSDPGRRPRKDSYGETQKPEVLVAPRVTITLDRRHFNVVERGSQVVFPVVTG